MIRAYHTTHMLTQCQQPHQQTARARYFHINPKLNLPLSRKEIQKQFSLASCNVPIDKRETRTRKPLTSQNYITALLSALEVHYKRVDKLHNVKWRWKVLTVQ